METFRYRTYDESDALIVDTLITEVDSTEMLYPESASVKKIILTCTSSAYVQIGYLSIGEYYQMPNPTAYYDEGIVITNQRSANLFGQVYGSDGVMLQTYQPDFAHVLEATFKEVRAIVEDVRNYKALFVDMTEYDHSYKAPLYATLDFDRFSNSRYARGVMRKGFQLSIREVR